MSDFDAARAALARTVKRVFPDATRSAKWRGIDAWAAPRPPRAVAGASTGTYDPRVIVIGIADRKAGPTVYFLDPGDYHALETHRALLEEAGLKMGRGCIYHTRKGPLPVKALEELFRRTKARDAKAGKRAPAKKVTAGRAVGSGGVDAYLAALPAPQRAALQKLRAQVHAAAPGGTEKMAYGIPTFELAGRNLVHMAAFEGHCSFFPGAAGVTLTLKEALLEYKTSKGTIQFTPSKPLPAALVKQIVKMRVAENEARAGKSRAAKPKRAPVKRPARA